MKDKIIYIVGFVVLAAVAFAFLFKKDVKEIIPILNKKDELLPLPLTIDEKTTQVEKKFSESQKSAGFALALKLYKDMHGINTHDMRIFAELLRQPDDMFFYVIQVAYPNTDPKFSFNTRLSKQDFKRVKSTSPKYTQSEALMLIASLKKRIENFTL